RCDRTIVGAIEECAGELDTLLILARRATSDAGTEALLDLEADAAGRAREDAEQLRLIGEVHRLVVRAVAQTECIVQLANRLGHPLRSLKGPVIDRGV